jgi:acetamidase/formamidase
METIALVFCDAYRVSWLAVFRKRRVLMQKKIAGLVLAVSLIAPLAVARAAEVTKISSNNLFAGANLNDEATQTTTSVFVSREKGKGAPRDNIFVIISGPSGFSFISGALPNGALKINKKKASLDVEIGDIAVVDTTGDLPADGVVSLEWNAGDVTRTSGNQVIEPGPGVRIHIHGHSTSAAADIDGSVLGTAMGNATGDISTVHDTVQIHVSTP